jgi:hypothetical protein
MGLFRRNLFQRLFRLSFLMSFLMSFRLWYFHRKSCGPDSFDKSQGSQEVASSLLD